MAASPLLCAVAAAASLAAVASAEPIRTVTVERPAGPTQARLPCERGATDAGCDLRVYQVMTGTFVDADPTRGYGTGYGPGSHLGDLKGVTAALDHVRALGMNAVWLTPIFDSRAGEPQHRADGARVANPRLDATGYYPRDYFAVDPRFGTAEDLRELVREARARGVGVILDAPFGHHKGDLVASPSGRLPVDLLDPAAYEDGPGGYPGRKVDFSDPRSADFFEEVAVWWIREFGVDGWRFDQAYQVPPEVWARLGAAIDAAARETGTRGHRVGEVFKAAPEIAAVLGTDAAPGLSAAFDFPARYALVQVLAVEESGAGRAPASTLNADWSAGARARLYPGHAAPQLMLGNHDLVRFGDLLQRGGIAGPEDAAYWRRHALAFAYMTAWSGPITVYYGEEIGQETPGFAARVETDCVARNLCDDHAARSDAQIPGVTVAPEALRPQARALAAELAALMALREAEPALSRGARTPLHADRTLYVDLKSLDGRDVVFAMNVGEAPARVVLSPAVLGGADLDARFLAGEGSATVEEGRLVLTLAPLGYLFVATTGR